MHLPSYPTDSWKSGSPLTGIEGAGVAMYKTDFNLDIEKGYDIPLGFDFGNCTGISPFRAQLYVNGYQFGKYGKRILLLG